MLIRRIINSINHNHIVLNLGIKRRISSVNQKKGPTELLINPVGFLCNHRCPMCWRENTFNNKFNLKKFLDNEKKHITINDYDKIFKELPWTINHITITGGGEPLLHPDIESIMSSIKKHGYYGGLITNGTLITDKFIEHTHVISWDYLRISLHASDRNTYKSIHGVDEFQKITSLLTNICNLKKSDETYSMNVGLYFAIQISNYTMLLDFYQYAIRHKVNEIVFGELLPINNKICLNEKQINMVISDLNKISQISVIKNNASELSIKYQLIKERLHKKSTYSKKLFTYKQCDLSALYLDSLGRIYPCCYLVYPKYILGDTNKQTAHHILKNSNYFETRNKVKRGKFLPECYKYCTNL
jgi:MoaA/NifB/PqqE/SkfB family radical SAM enzyme